MYEPLFYRELFIPSSIEGLNECLVIAKEIGFQFNLEFEKKLALQTVFVEAVENAIIHGNRKDRDLLVRVCIVINSNQIILEVEDEGEGFDLDSVPSPITSFNIRKESGRGIFFIKSFSASFCTLGKGNIIRIKINR